MSYEAAYQGRQSILDYLQSHQGATASDICNATGQDFGLMRNWITQCPKAKEIREETSWETGKRSSHYFPLKTETYWSGRSSASWEAAKAKISATNKKKQKDPHVRTVINSDKKPYPNQGGQGNIGWGPHIGTGSWGVV